MLCSRTSTGTTSMAKASEIYYGRRSQKAPLEPVAYMAGFTDALDALLSDETYYGALDASSSWHTAVKAAVDYVENGPFKLPHEADDE